MNINILVRPVYERQRAQSFGISNISNILYVLIGIRIRRVGLYANTPNLDILYPQADHRQLERLLIEASVISSLLCPTNEYQYPR
jgi:hypothetical protein